MHFRPIGSWQVLSEDGRRKYLSAAERHRFLAVMDGYPPSFRALGYVLAFGGCRISEALSLTTHQIDTDQCRLIFRTLKRRKLVYRAVPVPRVVIDMVTALDTPNGSRIWPMHRVTAFRHFKAAMVAAGIEGPMACCRGLRHGYGILAASSNVPPNLITKWMGHASGATTAVYLDAVGWEEREFAGRMWDGQLGA